VPRPRAHGSSVLLVGAARPPKLLPVLVDPLIRHWKGQGQGPRLPPSPLSDVFPRYPGFFGVPSPSCLPAPCHPGVTPGTISHPTCPLPGRDSQRAGCPRHRPRSSAGSTRRELRSAEHRGVWHPETEVGAPGLGLGTPKQSLEPQNWGLEPLKQSWAPWDWGLAPQNRVGSPGVGGWHPRSWEPRGWGVAPQNRVGSPGVGAWHPRTELGAPGLGFGTPKTELGAPELGFGTPKQS